MANHDRRTMRPGDLLAYEEWTPERGKVLLVLNVTQTTTCIRSDGSTVVERAGALRTATHLVADGMRA